MKLLISIFTSLLMLGWTTAATASDGGGRLKEVQEYNLSEGLAIQGYDPVSYFPEGGGVPLKGNPDLSMEFGGVTYNFVNEANLDLFMNEAIKNKQAGIKTLKYEPTYGGWCAYAMGKAGEKIVIKPNLYDLDGDRLHLFFSQGTLNDWLADKEALEKSADRKWKRILAKARRR